MTDVVGWFETATGAAMLGIWALLLATGQVSEITEGDLEIRYHLAAEGITAVALVVAGIMLLTTDGGLALRVSALALGALVYTTVNSAGYYATRGEWAAVGMFGVLFAGAVAGGIVTLAA